MSDISREAVERLADMALRYRDVVDVPETLLALRTALDAAEADKQRAVEAAFRAGMKTSEQVCRIVAEKVAKENPDG